jgi:hypothetical protein
MRNPSHSDVVRLFGAEFAYFYTGRENYPNLPTSICHCGYYPSVWVTLLGASIVKSHLPRCILQLNKS